MITLQLSFPWQRISGITPPFYHHSSPSISREGFSLRDKTECRKGTVSVPVAKCTRKKVFRRSFRCLEEQSRCWTTDWTLCGPCKFLTATRKWKTNYNDRDRKLYLVWRLMSQNTKDNLKWIQLVFFPLRQPFWQRPIQTFQGLSLSVMSFQSETGNRDPPLISELIICVLLSKVKISVKFWFDSLSTLHSNQHEIHPDARTGQNFLWSGFLASNAHHAYLTILLVRKLVGSLAISHPEMTISLLCPFHEQVRLKEISASEKNWRDFCTCNGMFRNCNDFLGRKWWNLPRENPTANSDGKYWKVLTQTNWRNKPVCKPHGICLLCCRHR